MLQRLSNDRDTETRPLIFDRHWLSLKHQMPHVWWPWWTVRGPLSVVKAMAFNPSGLKLGQPDGKLPKSNVESI